MNVLLAMTGCLLVLVVALLWQRRITNRQIAELKKEMQANQSANYGLARHVRALQNGLDAEARNPQTREDRALTSSAAAPSAAAAETVPFAHDAPQRAAQQATQHANQKHPACVENPGGSVADAEVDRLLESGADIERLADELGVSRTEAEIIAHLRPSSTSHS